jgi:hypothetical protein
MAIAASAPALQNRLIHWCTLYIQGLHHDSDYVEREWNINAIKPEPHLLNLKIRTQNIKGVNILSD